MERAARRHSAGGTRVEADRTREFQRNDAVPPVLAQILALQRTAGNRATCEAIARASDLPQVARMKRAAPPPRTGPKRVRVQTNAVDQERFWAGPAYGGFDKFRGGTSVTVDLGPAAGQAVNYGSTPGGGECKAVNSLNGHKFKNRAWIKGHLLNDNLGGPGLSANLTPMTHDANMDYKNRFESKVKGAVGACYSHGQNPDVNWYGVSVTVQVTGQRWAYAPSAYVQAVAQSVDTTCQYIYKPKAGGAVQPTAKPAWAPALPGAVSTPCYQ